MTSPATNSYSRNWFEFFHVGIDETRTAQEVAFFCSCAPLPEFREVLDVCCGIGRHARALSNLGYSVVGIERDREIVSQARKLGGGPIYVNADVRNYSPAIGQFDLAMVMSQSFGYFDAATNFTSLNHFASALRHGGRIILDLWNREFFNARPGEWELNTAAGIVQEQKHI